MSPLLKIVLMMMVVSPVMAGPNRNATVSLDINVSSSFDNRVDDKVIRATVNGFGTEFSVEVFVSPLAGPTIGGEVIFDLDPSIVRLKSLSIPNGLFALGTTDNSVTIGGFPPGVRLSNGYLATIGFITTAFVTNVPFKIGVERLVVVDGRSTTPDTLTAPTLHFNVSGSVFSASIDTDIEAQADNDGSHFASALNTGQTFQFQLFVPATANKRIVGYNLAIDNLNNFQFVSGVDWLNSPLILTDGGGAISALLLSEPMVTSSGYLGTITVRAQRRIRLGEKLRIIRSIDSTVGIAGSNVPLLADNEFVEFGEVVIRALAGDFDWDGDVDFADFVVFTVNFGKKGPVPNAGYVPAGR